MNDKAVASVHFRYGKTADSVCGAQPASCLTAVPREVTCDMCLRNEIYRDALTRVRR